jgi:hypothetical protein
MLSGERNRGACGAGIVAQDVTQNLVQDFGLDGFLYEVLRALL